MNAFEEPEIIRRCIQKVATGPEYSKDLEYEEAFSVMDAILSGGVDDLQAAILLIALRMKRETVEENCGILQALRKHSESVVCKVAEVIDISDPYDGYTRGVPASPFLPMVLASMGLNVITHGVNEIGPKCGTTFHKVYNALGCNVSMSCQEASQQVDSLGWAYVDQQRFSPSLYALLPIRQRMIKRQVLTTVESMIGPVRGAKETHLLGGYVHKAYPPIYEALARHSGFDSAVFVRGVEGGIIPSLQQKGRCFHYHGSAALSQRELSPVELLINSETRAIPIPDGLPVSPHGNRAAATVDSNAVAQKSAELGRQALAGKQGLMYDSLVYSGAIILTHLNHYDHMADAADAVKDILNSGEALKKLEAAII